MPKRDTTPISLLFVDSDVDDRVYWVRRLEISSPEYVITTADSGRAALDLCQSLKFDCVVLELALPDIVGFEVLVNLCPRPAKPKVPVVILTRLALASFPPLAKAHGAQSYLMKSRTSGDELDLATRKAIARVGPEEKKSPIDC